MGWQTNNQKLLSPARPKQQQQQKRYLQPPLRFQHDLFTEKDVIPWAAHFNNHV